MTQTRHISCPSVLSMLSFLDLETFYPSPPPISAVVSHVTTYSMFPGFILAGLIFIIALLISNLKLSSWVLPHRRQTPVTPPEALPEETHSNSKDSTGIRGNKEIDMMFATFDKNDDGVITAKELFESLRSMGISSTDSEAENMVRSADSNGDGVVDIEEFRKIYNSSIVCASPDQMSTVPASEEEEEREKDMKTAFDVFDENHDGQISVEELSVVLKSIGGRQGYSEEAYRDMISKVDLDGDGKVSYEEFKQMMKIRDGGTFLINTAY